MALRHTCASRLVAEDVPLSTISGILGDTDYALTRNVYADLTPELHTDAVKAIDRVLGAKHGLQDDSHAPAETF
jgi:integrase